MENTHKKNLKKNWDSRRNTGNRKKIRRCFSTEIQTKPLEISKIPQQVKTLAIRMQKIPQNAENPLKSHKTSEKYRKSRISWKLWQLGGVLAEKYICLPKRTLREKHCQGRNLGEVEEGAKNFIIVFCWVHYHQEQLF